LPVAFVLKQQLGLPFRTFRVFRSSLFSIHT
jgi:hypothetical protein